MIAASAALSTSVTKSLGCLVVTLSKSRSFEARLMIWPARRAALMAIFRAGCMGLKSYRVARSHPNNILKIEFYTMNPEVLLSRIRVVLCRPSHPGNIGAVARAMKTMGLSRLYLVSPKQFPDPEADTRATGAVDLLAKGNGHELIGMRWPAVLRRGAVGAPAGFGAGDSVSHAKLLPACWPRLRAEVALVFGNETVGLDQ
jgi:hypothetical protein